MDEKLKPCPFCGSRLVGQGHFGDRMAVACLCGARGPETRRTVPEVGPVNEVIDEAHEKWNTRPSAEPGEGEVRAAAKALLARLDETMPPSLDAGEKPTIEQLEAIMAANLGAVEIKPDGSIHTVPRTEIEALRASLSPRPPMGEEEIYKRADEILRRHLEYMGGPQSGQAFTRVSNARAAVVEALTLPEERVEGGGI